MKPVALSLNNGEGTEPFENGISLNSEINMREREREREL